MPHKQVTEPARLIPLIALKMFTRFELEAILEALDTSETALLERLGRLQERLDEGKAQMNAEQLSEYMDHVSGEAHFVSDVLPHVTRRALFLSAYALLEQHMHRVSIELRRLGKFDIAPRDLKDRGVERSKTYLKRVCGVDFPDDVSEWRLIRDCGALRNYLTHVGPYLDVEEATSSDVVKRFQDVPGVVARMDEEIQLERSFLERVIRAAQAWVDGLHGKARERAAQFGA